MKSLVLLLLALVPLAFSWNRHMENQGLFEGDIDFSPEDMALAKIGMNMFGSIRDYLWKDGKVPYVIEGSLMQEPKARKGIQAAIDDYHKYTCIKFMKRTNERNYLSFYKGGGCSSFVGNRYPGRQRVSLSKGCWGKDTVIHEIGHAIGLHHEQSRPDRDNWVTILRHNIARGTEHNFDKESTKDVDSRGTKYDYRSVMHYDETAFGSRKMTIKTKDTYYQKIIGKAPGFSEIDVQQINLMYGCQTTVLPQGPWQTNKCYDDSGACADGATEGNCNKSSWKRWMHANCRFSCKLCQGSSSSGKGTGGGTPPPATVPPRTDDTLPPVTVPPTTVSPGGTCVNKRNNCDYWANVKRYCSHEKWGAWMKANCCKACKGTTGNCKDRVVDCLQWKRNCEISSWLDYMKRNCASTCKYC